MVLKVDSVALNNLLNNEWQKLIENWKQAKIVVLCQCYTKTCNQYSF